MLRPVGLPNGHTEVRSFAESLPVFLDILGFEVIDEKDGEKTLRHPRTPRWPLFVHERPGAPRKPYRNHYGIRVQTNDEVTAGWKFVKANKVRFKIKRITKPIA